jgi:hypothetical protein
MKLEVLNLISFPDEKLGSLLRCTIDERLIFHKKSKLKKTYSETTSSKMTQKISTLLKLVGVMLQAIQKKKNGYKLKTTTTTLFYLQFLA